MLRDYSHRYSPKKFTQPQLFACLVLKEFYRLDYRKLTGLFRDAPELAQAIGLKSTPHFTTFQKAAERLLRSGGAGQLLTAAHRYAPLGQTARQATRQDQAGGARWQRLGVTSRQPLLRAEACPRGRNQAKVLVSAVSQGRLGLRHAHPFDLRPYAGTWAEVRHLTLPSTAE